MFTVSESLHPACLQSADSAHFTIKSSVMHGQHLTQNAKN